MHYQTVALQQFEIAPRVLANGSVALQLDDRRIPRERLRKVTSRSWAELGNSLELQGLPRNYLGTTPYTCKAACSLIGNAVALPMARELARAVRAALNGDIA